MYYLCALKLKISFDKYGRKIYNKIVAYFYGICAKTLYDMYIPYLISFLSWCFIEVLSNFSKFTNSSVLT